MYIYIYYIPQELYFWATILNTIIYANKFGENPSSDYISFGSWKRCTPWWLSHACKTTDDWPLTWWDFCGGILSLGIGYMNPLSTWIIWCMSTIYWVQDKVFMICVSIRWCFNDIYIYTLKFSYSEESMIISGTVVCIMGICIFLSDIICLYAHTNVYTCNYAYMNIDIER